MGYVVVLGHFFFWTTTTAAATFALYPPQHRSTTKKKKPQSQITGSWKFFLPMNLSLQPLLVEGMGQQEEKSPLTSTFFNLVFHRLWMRYGVLSWVWPQTQSSLIGTVEYVDSVVVDVPAFPYFTMNLQLFSRLLIMLKYRFFGKVDDYSVNFSEASNSGIVSDLSEVHPSKEMFMFYQPMPLPNRAVLCHPHCHPHLLSIPQPHTHPGNLFWLP